MKVLYILDYGTVGGATKSFLEMVVALKQKGIYPIVCLGSVTDIVEVLDNEGIQYHYIGHRTVLQPFNFKSVIWPLVWLKLLLTFYKHEYIARKNLKKKIDISQIDLIHTNSARNDIGCYLNKKYCIPHVVHIREFADADFNCIPFRMNYIKRFNQYSSRFIAISDAIKVYWNQKGLNGEKIETIYNGIHYEDISVSTDEGKNNGFRIIIAGGVCEAKGQHLAVEAMGYLPYEIRKNVYLDVAGWGGTGGYIQSMINYAEKRGFVNQIRFLGNVNNLHERLGTYQIGLMCSRAEGFGRTTAEYMHARLGIIASDSGANPELIEDGVTGLLFESGDAHSLSDCILRLYNDRQLVVRLSNNAQKKARSLYTQQRNAEAVFNLYNEIIKK